MNAAPHPKQFAFAALCANRVQLVAVGILEKRDAVDEVRAFGDYTGFIKAAGEDEAQRIMSEAFAAATLVPDLAEPDADELAELADALEIEIALRVAEMVRDWEFADPRDRWRHTREPRPIPRKAQSYAPRAPHTTPQSSVDAFWHVARLEDPDYLACWLAEHPTDAPTLYKIWKASRC